MPEHRPKTLLLLGGSPQQVVAIEAAKKLGYRTVICDHLPDNPGRLVADGSYLVSTVDRDAVLEVARTVQADGILAYASDPAAPIAAYVAEALGIPANPLPSVEKLSTKHLFREHLRRHGFACPRSATFSADVGHDRLRSYIAELTYPLVIKPTDASGSKGVSRIADESGLGGAFERAARAGRNGVLIAEEYIEPAFPHVIGGDIFVVDGKVRFWGLMSCLRDRRGNGLIPVGKKMPSGLSAYQLDAVRKTLQRLVTSLQIRFGEFNIEVLIGPDDAVYILEMAARAGGNMIPLELSDISGIDLVAANVLCAMGEDPGDISFIGTDKCFATYVLHSNQSGVIKEIALADEVAVHLYREVLYRSVGDTVGAFDGADKAVGILFLCFEDEACMNEILTHIDETAHVIVEAPQDAAIAGNDKTAVRG